MLDALVNEVAIYLFNIFMKHLKNSFENTKKKPNRKRRLEYNAGYICAFFSWILTIKKAVSASLRTT